MGKLKIVGFAAQQDAHMTNNEADDVPITVSNGKENDERKDREGSASPPATPPPADEDTNEIILVNEETKELDLNHGRIGKIENLEHLKKLERYRKQTNCLNQALII